MEIQKWEYKSLWLPLFVTGKSSLPDHKLNELGADGWELVSTIGDEHARHVALVFKRPIIDD